VDFFARQARARRASRIQTALFLLAVVAVIAAVDLLVGYAWNGLGHAQGSPRVAATAAVPWRLLAWVSAGTALLIFGASLMRMLTLAQGGGAVARGLGGTPVPADTRDPALRRLRNVVEEMSIAAGIPVPDLYLLEREAGINAFAAGHGPSDAAIAVTRGALERLDRDELQGVIGHEFSHILNGDMRLNLRLIGLAFGLLVLALAGQQVLRGGLWSRDRRNNMALVGIGLGLMIIGYLGVFAGNLLKAAVARSRERLADASAVQFTRQARGLAGALKKIAAGSSSHLDTPRAGEVSHMLFAPGLARALFASHPPLAERIRALEPGFDLQRFLAEDAPRLRSGNGAASAVDEADDADDAAPAGLAGLAASAGTLGPAPVAAGQQLHDALPATLRELAGQDSQAPWLLLALLLDLDAEVRTAQLARVAEFFDAAAAQRTQALADELWNLARERRLALALLALPSLRRWPAPSLESLRACAAALIRADGRITVFEYSLGAMIDGMIRDLARPAASDHGDLGLTDCEDAARLLLAVLAAAGHDAGDAAPAFQRGAALLFGKRSIDDAVPLDWPQRTDAALARLDRLAPAGKARLVEALEAVALADGRITRNEYELLRALSVVLHVPLPAIG
jgi:Zn-dependent protease with chaperone function